jgi:uncharacterized protein YjdB
MRTKKVLFLLLLLVFVSFTSGCLEGLFNKPPVIGSTPGTTAKVGMVYTYQIIATDPDEEDALTYTLSVKPDGMTINESTGLVSWTPGEDQIGENQVIIEVSDGKKAVSQNFTITVEEALLDSIVVLPSTMSMYIGDSEPIISITAYYDNETSAPIGLNLANYSSDDTDIATVNALTGVVTGVSEGTAIITVSYTEGGTTKTDTINVTVEELAILTAISVKPEFMIIYIGPGYSEPITSITASYDNGTSAPIELSSALFVSGTPAVATVGVNTGVVTGVSEGISTITVAYTEDTISMIDTVYVEVQEVPVLISITVLPEIMNIDVGDSETITSITADYSNGFSAPLADLSDASYVSDTPTVATVNSSGVVTGVSAGTAIITVSYTEGVITEIDTVNVTVE